MKHFGSSDKIDWPKVLRCLASVRFLHVMHNDKFNRPYIELIQKYCGNDGHVFLFFDGVPETELSIPGLDNVIRLGNRSQLFVLGLFLLRAPRVFFHSFLVHPLLFYAEHFRLFLKKASWIIWGADLYGDLENRESKYFKRKKALVRRLGALIVVAPGDFKIAQELYGFRGPGYYGLYRLPVERELLDRNRAVRAPGEPPAVQLNNSCDESILDGLRQLERFRDEALRIRVILSYGNLSARDRILEAGSRLFGPRFAPVTRFLPPDDYARLIWDSDVLLMNQPRQQGLGNIYGFLYRGAKVYVRSDVTTWSFLKDMGFEIFDALKVGAESFESFLLFDESARQKNRRLAAGLLDDDHIARLWRDIFARRAPDLSRAAEGPPARASS